MLILFSFHSSFSSGYIQLSSLKTRVFHKILVNKKIKTDFKRITSNDAYQLASFWYSELAKANAEESYKSRGINLLYRPTKYIFDNSINLTDVKYNIISDDEDEYQYYIWRPKVQICVPSLYSAKNDEESNAANNNDSNENQKTLLYPSFRETMYLLSLDMKDRTKKASVNNIVQSPYWNEPWRDSYEILQCSVNQFFVDYLKYPGLEYK